ncbi:Actin-related protein 5 [Savitreella phatthalungensis]
MTIYQAPGDRPRRPTPAKTAYAGKGAPIVFDNGTQTFRAGFAGEAEPRLCYDNLYARYRTRSTGVVYQIVGDDVHSDPTLRTSIKSPYDGTIVVNWDAMENVIDYALLKMSVEDNSSNPVVMTETVSNLPGSRKAMTELLFECYGVPSLAYGIDALFSYHHNKGGREGLVVSAGHQATHLIPVVDGKAVMPACKRLSLGGTSIPDYLLRLLQLKYPGFPTKLSYDQAVELAREHCYISQDYDAELRDYLVNQTDDHKDCAIQFPYTEVIEQEKSAEEIAIAAQRKHEAAQRLREANEAKRAERLAQQENDLAYYLALQARSQEMGKRDFAQLLESEDFENERQLDGKIKSLQGAIRKTRNRMAGIVEDEPAKEAPDFSLVDVPDDKLDEAQLKQKRAQRLMKFGYDARQRAKEEKAKEEARLAEERRQDEERRKVDPSGWVAGRRAARQAVLDRIRDRKKLKADLSDRKSAASQARMKQLAGLAANDTGKRKRGGGGGGAGGDDGFGASDADWGVYRDVAVGGADDDSDDEEEDQRRLQQLESELLEHDPDFTDADTQDAQADPSKSILHTFLYGRYNHEAEAKIKDDKNALLARDHQLHLNVERIRCPETLFRPSLVGLDACGLVEIANGLITQHAATHPTRPPLYADVFLTGGSSLLRGFGDRIKRDLTAVLPWKAPLKVRSAEDPVLDGWRGASEWASGDGLKHAGITRKDYDEFGPDYIKEHALGNVQL